MTLDEAALAHGMACCRHWTSKHFPGGMWGRAVLTACAVVVRMPHRIDPTALDLACLMYAQDVAEGRHR